MEVGQWRLPSPEQPPVVAAVIHPAIAELDVAFPIIIAIK
jgi:hypothetical protein